MGDRQCERYVLGHGRCELGERHHGPCTVTLFDGRKAQAYLAGVCPADKASATADSKGCVECDRIDAAEVLRLDAGGALGPLQRRPSWLINERFRPRMVAWANRVLAEAAGQGVAHG
jgi:hypothetical protein